MEEKIALKSVSIKIDWCDDRHICWQNWTLNVLTKHTAIGTLND